MHIFTGENLYEDDLPVYNARARMEERERQFLAGQAAQAIQGARDRRTVLNRYRKYLVAAGVGASSIGAYVRHFAQGNAQGTSLVNLPWFGVYHGM